MALEPCGLHGYRWRVITGRKPQMVMLLSGLQLANLKRKNER